MISKNQWHVDPVKTRLIYPSKISRPVSIGRTRLPGTYLPHKRRKLGFECKGIRVDFSHSMEFPVLTHRCTVKEKKNKLDIIILGSFYLGIDLPNKPINVLEWRASGEEGERRNRLNLGISTKNMIRFFFTIWLQWEN